MSAQNLTYPHKLEWGVQIVRAAIEAAAGDVFWIQPVDRIDFFQLSTATPEGCERSVDQAVSALATMFPTKLSTTSVQGMNCLLNQQLSADR